MQSETQPAEQLVEKICGSDQAPEQVPEQAIKKNSTFDQSLYPFDTAKDQLELSKLLRNFKHDLTLHGVMSLDRMPFNPENETKFRSVDGRGVPQEQWFHPDKSLLPPPLPLTDGQRRFGEANKEKNMKMLEERANRPRCPLRIVSDHDLGLRVDPSREGN
ncbi:hypothetical protein NCS52_01443100 [Fusarium sp. LHS14.1]|nr:hypothetical protein NCS52_01443100 [Fusarium sp. LHS14.1]